MGGLFLLAPPGPLLHNLSDSLVVISLANVKIKIVSLLSDLRVNFFVKPFNKFRVDKPLKLGFFSFFVVEMPVLHRWLDFEVL